MPAAPPSPPPPHAPPGRPVGARARRDHPPRHAGDAAAVERLAELDSRRAPRGTVLLAEVGRELRGRPSRSDDGHVVADPFRPTADLVRAARRAQPPARALRPQARPATARRLVRALGAPARARAARRLTAPRRSRAPARLAAGAACRPRRCSS